MKRVAFVVPSFLLVLAACGGAPQVGVTTPNAATVAPPVPKEDARVKETTPEALDPLNVGGSLDAASVPTIAKTPAKELRPLGRGDLEAAMKLLGGSATPEAALKKLVARLGKPTWTENEKKRVWIAKDGKNCHRFVFDSDGQADFESAPASEWRMLSATARQNACTGEIKKGDLGGS